MPRNTTLSTSGWFAAISRIVGIVSLV